ncbi:hypothetical protein ACH40D_45140 [Streptomyces olivaceoviridis]|uniref:Uncharacterized protein n=1 Tax=Streptomyces olivaceoviridis TaxID=1921 RepID=A0ABW7VMY9_STROI|nr:hypothetical protein [Streptomyces corchorusii]
MGSAPVVAHRPSQSGGRRVTVHWHGRDEVLGLAHSDHDLVVFLEAAGVGDPDGALGDPLGGMARGRPHQWSVA